MNIIFEVLNIYEQALISIVMMWLLLKESSYNRKVFFVIVSTIYLYSSMLIVNSFMLFEGFWIIVVLVPLAIIAKILSKKAILVITITIGAIFIGIYLSTYLTSIALSTIFQLPTLEIYSNQNVLLLGFMMSKLIFTGYAFLMKNMDKSSIKLNKKELSVLLLFELNVLFIVIVFMGLNLENTFNVFIYIGLIASLVLGVCVWKIYVWVIKNNKLSIEKEKEIERLKYESQKYHDLVVQYAEIRHLKHDIKHIKNLIEDRVLSNELNDKLGRELTQQFQMIEETNEIIFSSNEELNYILNYKIDEAKKAGIRVKCQVIFSDFSFMKSTDLYVLFGNVLDNAIENIDKENPEIGVIIKNKNSWISIKVTNYSEHKDENTLLKTSKSDYSSHGIGHKTINNIAEKYCGFSKFAYESGVFTTIIMLKHNQVKKISAHKY